MATEFANPIKRFVLGVSYRRTVRHLDAFGYQVYLKRLSCKVCAASFVWHYAVVAPKKRYTKAFEATLPKQAIGATIRHTARVTETPVTTVARRKKLHMFNKPVSTRHLSQNPVLGLDDFAIRQAKCTLLF